MQIIHSSMYKYYQLLEISALLEAKWAKLAVKKALAF
jgi:hypothetical protein